ncbi:MAG: ABC transporter permease [Bacteroidetes bacterium]|nr:ABC transporter permease [Bacteroidota bacterium]
MSKSVLIEQIKVAVRSIQGQALRTTLTVAIISIGIMALIAMVTATESLKENIRTEFSSLGTNTFTIKPKRQGGFFNGRRSTPTSIIDYRETRRV